MKMRMKQLQFCLPGLTAESFSVPKDTTLRAAAKMRPGTRALLLRVAWQPTVRNGQWPAARLTHLATAQQPLGGRSGGAALMMLEDRLQMRQTDVFGSALCRVCGVSPCAHGWSATFGPLRQMVASLSEGYPEQAVLLCT